MAEGITNYKCPACTGPLKFNGEKNKLECEYCGSLFTEDEVKLSSAGPSKMWDEAADGVKAYNCPSCGAELIFDETTVATSCPYCDNPTVVPSKLEGALKPDLVIPFKLEKKAAVEALKNHYKGKKLLPDSFTEGNRVEEIKGVYVPFWLFDGRADADVRYKGIKEDRKETDDEIITTTEFYDVYRAGYMDFEKVPVDASSKMPDDHMDSIEPYDYTDLREFTTAYLPGYMAEKFDVSKEECEKRADLRFTNSVLNAMRDDVEGYDSVSEESEKVDIKRGKVNYALFPVWMLSTKWNGQNFLFAMNGQTGKLIGDLPADKGKLYKYFGITFAIALAVVALLAFVVFKGDPAAQSSNAMLYKIGATILLPLLCAFIRVGSLKAQLKSVHTAVTANGYAKGKATFTVRDDIYVRTETRREQKSKD
jgi:DNA-directed RNA polymerase subunit RPC12/RpoP